MFFLKLIFDSLPAINLAILDLCLYITNDPTKIEKIKKYLWVSKNIERIGNNTAAEIEARETIRDIATMIAKVAINGNPINGYRANIVPAAVATPLPPLKPRKIG